MRPDDPVPLRPSARPAIRPRPRRWGRRRRARQQPARRRARRLLPWLVAAVVLVLASYLRTSTGLPAWAVLLIELPPLAVAAWRTRGRE